MNKVMSNVLDVFEFRFQTIDTEVEMGDLPPCLGDETQIGQVFANLVDNALKYRNSDRPGIIRISGRNEGEEVIYCVEDDGLGIAPEHQQKIYEIFHRLNPDQNHGEGLGLTIVHRILDRHRGKIWVESEPGHGSKFFVSLPAGQAQERKGASSDE
jgi:signal transduction histidine kinase